MLNTSRPLAAVVVALASASVALAQVNSNNSTLSNGGDFIFLFSSPSSGFTAGANPPDVAGDWYYKVWEGAGTLNHVTALGSVMEVDGFYESLFDTFWGTIGSPASSAPDFYARTLGPAVASTTNPGILEPGFVTAGFTTETLVIVGNSGFGNPCTVAPSFCSPPGSTCPPSGFVNGYLVELNFSSTPGTGVVLPADGTSASDTALTYFVTGGMVASGGPCGLGDYGLQDVHSTDETQADLAGGLNIAGGFQLGGGGPQAEGVASMLAANLTFRDRIVQMRASTAGGCREFGDNGGGATNGRRLAVGSGLSTIGVEVRDLASSTTPNLTVAGASLVPIPNPGVPVFGQANLLVVPDGLFSATSGLWMGAVTPTVFTLTSEGAFSGVQLPIASSAAGINLNTQGLVVDLTFPPVDTFRSTNVAGTVFSSAVGSGGPPCPPCGNPPPPGCSLACPTGVIVTADGVVSGAGFGTQYGAEFKYEFLPMSPLYCVDVREVVTTAVGADGCVCGLPPTFIKNVDLCCNSNALADLIANTVHATTPMNCTSTSTQELQCRAKGSSDPWVTFHTNTLIWGVTPSGNIEVTVVPQGAPAVTQTLPGPQSCKCTVGDGSGPVGSGIQVACIVENDGLADVTFNWSVIAIDGGADIEIDTGLFGSTSGTKTLSKGEKFDPPIDIDIISGAVGSTAIVRLIVTGDCIGITEGTVTVTP